MHPPAIIQGTADNVGRLLKTNEVCALLGYCARTIRRKIQRGELPKPIKVGKGNGGVRFLETEIQALLQARKAQR